MRTIALSLVAFFACSAAWADSPFDGTWQLNATKSQLAGDTMSFDDAGGGTDGSSFTTPMGIERTFQKTAEGYTTTNKKNGLLISSGFWKLSDDTNTLVIESKGTKPNGDTFDNLTTYVRTAPGTGLIGGWKSTKVKLSNPNSLTLQSNGGEVTLTISAIKATCHANWDGKDYPATGPTVPDGITVAVSKSGPNSFKLVEKYKGKVLEIIHYQLAADGKSMTAKGTNGEGKEPFTEVYDKQS